MTKYILTLLCFLPILLLLFISRGPLDGLHIQGPYTKLCGTMKMKKYPPNKQTKCSCKKEFLKCKLHNFLGTCFVVPTLSKHQLAFFWLGLIFRKQIQKPLLPTCQNTCMLVARPTISMWGMPYQVDPIPLFLPLSLLNQAMES